MAPACRKSGNRVKVGELRPGDLVLAKVKGFPAWPAKISKPEAWKGSPGPKKYFVQFFGTSEIAFVAPADIQVFTHESKGKLAARCQGKNVKCFARAVEEICEAFEELQQKRSGEIGEDNIDQIADDHASTSIDDIKEEHHESAHSDEQQENLDQMVNDKNVFPCGELHGLECSTQNQDGMLSSDLKTSGLDGRDSSSVSVNRRKKGSNNGMHTPKGGKITFPKSSSGAFFIKEDGTLSLHPDTGVDNIMDEYHANKTAVALPKVSTASRNHNLHESGEGRMNLVRNEPSIISLHSKSVAEPVEVNGLQVAKVVPETKRKVDNALKLQKKCSFRKQLKQSPIEGMKQFDEDKIISSCDGAMQSENSPRVAADDIHGDKFGSNHVMKKGSAGKYIFWHGLDKGQPGNTGKKPELGIKEHKMAYIEDSQDAKRLRFQKDGVDMAREPGKGDPSHFSAKNKGNITVKCRESTCNIKIENYLASRMDKHDDGSDLPCDEAMPPLSKRCRCVPQVVSNPPTEHAADGIMRDNDECPVAHVHFRQRSFLLDDDDDDEKEDRTPVHKESGSILISVQPDILVPVKNSRLFTESCTDFPLIDNSLNENLSSSRDVKLFNDRSSPSKVGSDLPFPSPGKTEAKRSYKAAEFNSLDNTEKPECQISSSGEARATIMSPTATAGLHSMAKLPEHKSCKTHVKASSMASVKTAQASSSELSSQVTQDSYNSQKQRNETFYALEKLKVTPMSNTRKALVADGRSAISSSTEQEMEKDISSDRSEVFKGDKVASSSINSKFADSFTSMRHLIAAAQAKRKQAHSQCLAHEITILPSVSTLHVLHGRSPSPVSGFHSASSGVPLQKDTKGFNTSASFGSACKNHCGLTSSQGEHEEYEHGIIPGYTAAGGSLSGGAEAAVARDAFEGMIETLSRTKESIGRATRLAIDCAKYGIANEVVELLIRKLESEPSFHRRVDLFFLVDSITQCSHSQKGIAEASYIPTVQAALPRLLGAAAPSGPGAHENRRQCLKVLRLWLERKILPEPLLRQYMDDIEVRNDDMNAGFFLRRPSRSERSVDDPIMEMEGMLVDEYGSNATFQLPGFFPSNIFEDEEDLPSSLCKDSRNNLPVEAASALEEADTCVFTPSDRHHHILEDVDGELEMEDVSTSSKDEKGLLESDSFKVEVQHQYYGGESELTMTSLTESPPLPIGPPPLPLDSPPQTPPLPPSSPPPLPPPPPLSPPPPLPLPPPALPPPPSLPPPPPLPLSLPSLLYHPSMPQENLSGTQLIEKTGNATIEGHGTADVNSEMVLQHIPSFLTPGICNAQPMPSFNSSVPFEYSHSQMYITSRSSLPNHQYHQGAGSFQQRPYHPFPTMQTPSCNSHLTFPTPSAQISYARPIGEQNVQQMYNPYSLPSLLNGHSQGQYNSEQQQRIHYCDSSSDNQHGAWVAGVRSTSCSGAPFVQDGFFGSITERPSSNSRGLQLPLHSCMPARASVPAHDPSQLLPSRLDIHTLNCWRPT